MPVYNNDEFLADAIESILVQTFTDFEFLLINDGSTDQSAQILAIYADKDDRIQIIDNITNFGITRSLNKGLSMATGEYIARMDADDISLPTRFEKQVAYLDKHPEIWVVGGQAEFIDAKGNKKKLSHSYPTNENLVMWNAILNGPVVIHPSVMMRREKINQVGKYPEDCKLAQDAALWREIYMCFGLPIMNLGEVVLLYRLHPTSLGEIFRTAQVDSVINYQTLFYEHILQDEIPIELVSILNFPSRFEYSADQAKESVKLLIKLFQTVQKKYSFDSKTISKMKKDVSQRITSIVYRYPLSCLGYVLYSLYLSLAAMKQYVLIYSDRFTGKLNKTIG